MSKDTGCSEEACSVAAARMAWRRALAHIQTDVAETWKSEHPDCSFSATDQMSIGQANAVGPGCMNHGQAQDSQPLT